MTLIPKLDHQTAFGLISWIYCGSLSFRLFKSSGKLILLSFLVKQELGGRSRERERKDGQTDRPTDRQTDKRKEAK